MKLITKSVILSLGLFAATAAQAANAIVTTDLNLRTGPGTRYPIITGIPNKANVDVRGCTRGYNWCQVGFRGAYGWASSRYLAMRIGSPNGSTNNFGSSAAAIGIPLIAGVLIGSLLNNNNDDRYDRGRYYRDRYYSDRYDRYDRWSQRERPYYRPGWNSDGYRIGNGVRPSQGNFYNPYNN